MLTGDSGIRLEKVRIEVQARDVWRKECSRKVLSFKENKEVLEQVSVQELF